MITSKLQLKASIGAAESLREVLKNNPSPNWGEDLALEVREKTQRKLINIEEKIAEYELYTSGNVTHIPLFPLDELMKAPIRIRLVMNESVKEFADEINVNKRQVLRYEEEQYENCSMATFKKIIAKVEILIENVFDHKTA